MQRKLACLCLLAAFRLSYAAAPDFASTVFPVLDRAGCGGCHNPDGIAAGTRLQFPEREARKAALERFGRSLQRLVNRSDPDNSLLLLKPTLRTSHAGGRRIVPGTADETALRSWVRYLATQEAEAAPEPVSTDDSAPQRPVLRRLTHVQYNNTVRDLLGDDSNIATQFPPEDFVHGFRNQYSAQAISPLLAEAYAAAAEKLAKNAFRGGDTRGLVPCKAAPGSENTCATGFIRSFGRKAFRRPLLESEVERYRKLFASGGAQLVVEAMLQSPNFLLRTENGSEPAWRAYQTASRLSYFLWNSMPDEALFRAAEAGELSSPAGIERAARRMLTDPRARAAVDDFIEQWLRFDRLLTSVKDRRAFPQFTPELALAMTEETRRLVSELVWNNRSFMELYTADYAYLSSSLAELYGVPVPEREFDRVSLPAATERAGILGQAMFLAATSKPAETSPTARGLFVREQFLCQEVPQPPPGVAANLPPLTKDKPQTNRERLSVHMSSESCSGCHNLIDPIGLGMEKFDAIGQRREKLKLTFSTERKEKPIHPVTVELELDTRGEVAGLANSSFSSPRQLGTILAASRQCQECVVKQVFRYAMGRKETPADRPVIGRIYEDFRDSQFRFQELMIALLKWTAFPPGREASASGAH
ncbi:MAG TPA: DUF1592 domain-containing protein [Bryobacteraceae bacterium]|nr:DUF1592 domain-containing protein [Bryobacteraceae bacterium]